jgi:uncharacterized protein (TIGR00369 family)
MVESRRQPSTAPVTAIPLGDRRLLMRPHGCFACGELNVSGLHLQLHADAGVCWAEPTLDERFMGWEGIAHGGIICAILDEVMAWALVDEDCWGVTARLSVDFRRPVPIGRRLRAEGRVIERRRRVIRTEAHLSDPESGVLYATATATYVDAPPERKDELKRRYEFRVESAAAPRKPAADDRDDGAASADMGGAPQPLRSGAELRPMPFRDDGADR